MRRRYAGISSLLKALRRSRSAGAAGSHLYRNLAQPGSAFGLSVEQIYQDLAQQNSVTSAGSLVVDGQRLVIDPTGDVSSVEALANVVVSTPETGTTIRLAAIADISRGYADPPQMIMRFNGEPALALGVSNVSGVNVVDLGAQIEAALEEEIGRRPYGLEVHEYYNQAKSVDESVQSFALNVVAALVIVLVTLFLFMGLRASIVIGATLLFTIAATLATMNAVGIPMHRISLGALIIALGMLVDNAIVVTEGIMVGVAAGRRKIDIAERSSRVPWPLGGTVVGILPGEVRFAINSTAIHQSPVLGILYRSSTPDKAHHVSVPERPLVQGEVWNAPSAPEDDRSPTTKASCRHESRWRSSAQRSLHYRCDVGLPVCDRFLSGLGGARRSCRALAAGGADIRRRTRLCYRTFLSGRR